MANNYKQKAANILSKADVTINGDKPWDIKVHNEEFYERIFREGSIAVGESYMDGWWDAPQLDDFFYHVLRAKIEKNIKWNVIFDLVKAKIFNFQSKSKAHQVAEEHYDVGNDLYTRMLDKRMQYTCGYWKNAETLDQAQENKLDLICRKLKLQPGEKVLEVGGGFGWFAKFAAEKYGVHVTSVNISEEQMKYSRELCKGLPVEIVNSDYRDVTGIYDKVAAIGIAEHVGYKNYRTLMEVGHRSLKPGGLFLVHTIASSKAVVRSEPWFDKYIFPNGMLPSPKQFGAAMDGLFVLEDWHNFGVDYDKTLRAWYENFDSTWDEIKDQYSDRFYRMWKFYLLSLAGAFRARTIQLWQLVLSKDGVEGGYESER
jgi:cyclopropane-fatty-acyl-phospholipid synthase